VDKRALRDEPKDREDFGAFFGREWAERWLIPKRRNASRPDTINQPPTSTLAIGGQATEW
jgi:hypothetical protein